MKLSREQFPIQFSPPQVFEQSMFLFSRYDPYHPQPRYAANHGYGYPGPVAHHGAPALPYSYPYNQHPAPYGYNPHHV